MLFVVSSYKKKKKNFRKGKMGYCESKSCAKCYITFISGSERGLYTSFSLSTDAELEACSKANSMPSFQSSSAQGLNRINRAHMFFTAENLH